MASAKASVVLKRAAFTNSVGEAQFTWDKKPAAAIGFPLCVEASVRLAATSSNRQQRQHAESWRVPSGRAQERSIPGIPDGHIGQKPVPLLSVINFSSALDIVRVREKCT